MKTTKEGEVLASSLRISIYSRLNSHYGLDSVKDRIAKDITLCLARTTTVSPPSLYRQKSFLQPLHPTPKKPTIELVLLWPFNLATWCPQTNKWRWSSLCLCNFQLEEHIICDVVFQCIKLNKCYIWKPGRHNCCITIIQLFDEQDDSIAATTNCRNIHSYIYKYLFLKSRKAELQQPQ